MPLLVKILTKCSFLKSHSRNLSAITAVSDIRNERRAKAWQIHSYGQPSDLQNDSIRIPELQDPNELLIKVEAASVNPIDNAMIGGYGRTILQVFRNFEMELPLIVGRDFCGTIIHKGLDVGKNFKIGDEVYGFIPLHKQGSFCDIVITDQGNICHKPPHLSPVEASSIVYTTMTAWAALYITGNLLWDRNSIKNKNILILGASGGVGTMAVQLLKAQNCKKVVGTCCTDAIPLVTSLGADEVIDYKDPDYADDVAKEGSYDMILDCAKIGPTNIPKNWNYKQYIVLNSPLLVNTDRNGLAAGLVQSVSALLDHNVQFASNGRCVKWAFFIPSISGFQLIDQLVREKKIRPVIQKEYSFENLRDALMEVANGHMRGKVVVNFGM